MKQLILETEIFKFQNCKDFAEQFNVGEKDLILTNEYIYNPNFANLSLKANVIFQEKYGMGEPTDVMVDALIADANKLDINRIIAIGGGTIIDLSKILSVTNGEGVDYLYDNVANLTSKKELVIIPTTCGTGSEVTSIAVVNRTRKGTKLGLVNPAMYPAKAVLIPSLLKGLPFPVFAASSLDALIHAVESALSPKANAFSKMYSYKAIEMILKGFQRIVTEGKDARLEMLDDFLTASTFGGIAFGTAGCAAVHATSFPLGGVYHVPHGESNYAMFTAVLNCYMSIKQDGEIDNLNNYFCSILGCEKKDVYVELEKLLNQILQKKPLREYGMKEEEIDIFAKSVCENQGRLMANNFVVLTEDNLRNIYRLAY